MAAVVRGSFTDLLQPALSDDWFKGQYIKAIHLEGKRCISCGAPPSMAFPKCEYCGSVWSFTGGIRHDPTP